MHLYVLISFPDSLGATVLEKSQTALMCSRIYVSEYKEKRSVISSGSEVIMGRNLRMEGSLNSVHLKEFHMNSLHLYHHNRMELLKGRIEPFKNLLESCYMPRNFHITSRLKQ